VSPGGEVGIGNMTPDHRLDVGGDVRGSARAAFGNGASIGSDGVWDKVFDFTHTITDFSSTQNWDPFRSIISVVPTVDLTGANATYIYSHDLIVESYGHDKDIEYLTGPYLAAFKGDTGTHEIFGGPFSVALSSAGHVAVQFGSESVSIGSGNATIDKNYALTCRSGHWGGGGAVDEDFSLYVSTPDAFSPLTKHYGIYLEDQEVATDLSYAIYSDGGDVFLRGDVGIGEDQPAAALHVAGDFVATGTKSFAQPHPADPTKQIWFVCLEGNEAGTYFRGTARLEGGRAVVPVPADFRAVSETDG
jgi:hypothetical protein